MLFQWITCCPDFEKSLKRRRLAALALLAVGLTGLVCYALLVPGSPLGDYARGFYLGAASGLTAASLLLLVRLWYLQAHPEARKRAKIRETDEREVSIARSAFQIAGAVIFFTAAAALFVVLPLSWEAFAALLAVVLLYAAVFWGASLWIHRFS